jgi:hypothetical protein
MTPSRRGFTRSPAAAAGFALLALCATAALCSLPTAQAPAASADGVRDLPTAQRGGTPELLWETPGFVAPESAVFDHTRNQFYVSNMGSWGEGATAGDDFISRVSADGRILDLRWVTGLESPEGLALANGRLYVGDYPDLVEIDPAKGAIRARYAPAGGPGGFNDCTADPAGNVYVFSGGSPRSFVCARARSRPGPGSTRRRRVDRTACSRSGTACSSAAGWYAGTTARRRPDISRR